MGTCRLLLEPYPRSWLCCSWNILHLLCAKGDANGMKLLQHVLKHLPKEAVERLLRQQTKELRVTACHIT